MFSRRTVGIAGYRVPHVPSSQSSAKLPRNGFDAIAWLDPPLHVSRRVAGKSYQVRIAGRPTVLSLPSVGPKEMFGGGSAAEGPTPSFPPPPLSAPLVSGARAYLTMSARTPPGMLIVEAIRLRWTDPARTRSIRRNEDLGDGFDKPLGAWLAVVRDWLAAWRGATRGPIAQEATPSIRLATSASRGTIGGGGYAAYGVHMPARRWSKPSALEAAFIAASEGRELPIEHQLFSEALAYAAGARRRHAVISACSASEVAVSESLRRFLADAGRGERERKEVLDRSNGIMALCRLHAMTVKGLPLSLRVVQKALAAPRNRAAHAGQEPDDHTVERALVAARALLSLSPLPSPATIIKNASCRL
jgi:hypothetical protein